MADDDYWNYNAGMRKWDSLNFGLLGGPCISPGQFGQNKAIYFTAREAESKRLISEQVAARNARLDAEFAARNKPREKTFQEITAEDLIRIKFGKKW